ncbi:MAG: DUF2726 domain-containing protein [Anaerolineales bacterium]|mgnify:FL=1|jgi:hypothetical protein|nr:hypothetical protein [Anaerolineales bacterium]MCC7512530.1 DUF2726 domain-containing protein [Anaerolineae bacterium]OQY82783.1 MAG: hypothetical protein B6D40_08285 [Anaerolineae bacterium UTCFX3]GER81190.1 conserved hypothetical protein [Candidatus Denitrolinea symbiosum]MBW7918553.1 DUF2726 domain-containing protein [Anaerolineales bacterium]
MPDSKPPNAKADSPYRLRERLLSAPEAALFRLLQKMAGDRYVVCPKVALTDIFTIIRPNENVHFYNKIFRKHVDFLLCDPKTFQPAFAVELVKPIAKTETRANDQFMADLFLSEGVPLVHVPLGESYEVADLVNLFTLAVTKAKSAEPRRNDSAGDSVPMCPVCGKMMALRIHRGGPQAGKRYYGCMDSPRCAGVAAVD